MCFCLHPHHSTWSFDDGRLNNTATALHMSRKTIRRLFMIWEWSRYRHRITRQIHTVALVGRHHLNAIRSRVKFLNVGAQRESKTSFIHTQHTTCRFIGCMYFVGNSVLYSCFLIIDPFPKFKDSIENTYYGRFAFPSLLTRLDFELK